MQKCCNEARAKNEVSIHALVLNAKDNVATAIVELKEKTSAIIQFADGSKSEIVVLDNIPIYHKLALFDISCDDLVVKYGYPIGRSKEEIKKGKYVHIHNIASEQEAR